MSSDVPARGPGAAFPTSSGTPSSRRSTLTNLPAARPSDPGRPAPESRRSTLTNLPAVRPEDAGRAPAPPESRRSTLRLGTMPAPASRPTGADSETYGRIHRMVGWLDTNKGPFTIARLTSHTGVNLRTFTPETRDDARVLSKLWSMLDVLLTEEERLSLLRALREG